MKWRILPTLSIIFYLTFNTLLAAPFADLGDQTILDQKTGLIWQKEDDNQTRSWDPALRYCEALALAGKTDWRLPNSRELKSITDTTRYNPAIDTAYFPNTNSSSYWSSTTYAGNTSRAWDVYFSYGDVGYGNKAGSKYVRCVRAGQ